jgi:hypothetical protein
MRVRTTFSELGCRLERRGWRVEARVRGIAGALVLASAILAAFVSPWWLLLTAFVGLNLIQSAMSDWCLMSNLIALLFPTLRGANDR